MAAPKLGGSFFDKNVPKIVLKSLFSKYDKDGSGQLNRQELKGLFVDDLGLSKEQAESYSFLLDKDGNGSVSFDEFNAWLHSGEQFKNINDSSRYYKLKKAVELFKSYDKDDSGALDKDEFEKLFLAFGGTPCTQRLHLRCRGWVGITPLQTKAPNLKWSAPAYRDLKPLLSQGSGLTCSCYM